MQSGGTPRTSSQVVGYYTTTDDVELEGDPEALRHLASLLTTSMPLLVCSLYTPPSGSPAPYDDFLTTIRIQSDNGAICMRRQHSTLIIAGSRANRSVLAENVTWLADHFDPSEGSAHHLHIEYYSTAYDSYLDPSVLPLIVTCTKIPGRQ